MDTVSNSPLLICISEFLLELNCPELLKHCKQSHFCYSVLWSRLPLALYCCCLSFSNSIEVLRPVEICGSRQACLCSLEKTEAMSPKSPVLICGLLDHAARWAGSNLEFGTGPHFCQLLWLPRLLWKAKLYLISPNSAGTTSTCPYFCREFRPAEWASVGHTCLLCS